MSDIMETTYEQYFSNQRKSDNKKFVLKILMENDKFLYDEYDQIFTELSIYYTNLKKYPCPDD